MFTTQVEEIVTSQPGVDANGVPVTSLSLSNHTEVSFTFAQPIPINATDVYLQVVYRGVLGSENDAVVVATKDISEPSHFTIANTTDYLFCVNSTLYRNNADGSISAAARNAIVAAGGAQSTADDPIYQKRAHARVLFIAQAPYVQPFSSVNPLTVNPQVKVLADRSSLNYGQHMRLAYLTDRVAGTAFANVNQFEIGIADQLPDRVSARVPTLQYFNHFLHQLSDDNPIVTAVMAFRNFRTGSSIYTVNEYGSSCDNLPDSTFRAINHSNPSLSTLVPFTTISF